MQTNETTVAQQKPEGLAARQPEQGSPSEGGSARVTKTELRVVRCAGRVLGGQRAVISGQWSVVSNQMREGEKLKAEIGFLTRRELAAVLKVSVRTVDEMVAAKEITALRPGGVLVRFYLPDVVRQLTAAAVARLEKLKVPGNQWPGG